LSEVGFTSDIIGSSSCAGKSWDKRCCEDTDDDDYDKHFDQCESSLLIFVRKHQLAKNSKNESLVWYRDMKYRLNFNIILLSSTRQGHFFVRFIFL
jgi:hypothetical protein